MEDQQVEHQRRQQRAVVPPDVVHPFILSGIDDFGIYGGSEPLKIEGPTWEKSRLLNRGSALRLVNFIREDHPPDLKVSRLKLTNVEFEARNPSSTPDDITARSGMDIWGDFLISDTELTSIKLEYCEFESREAALELMAAFEQNKTAVELTIYAGIGLDGAECGAALSRLMQNNTTLKYLDCNIYTVSEENPRRSGESLRMEGVRALAPGLRVTCLEGLGLARSHILDDDLGCLVDGLVGNTKMKEICVSENCLTPKCLVHLTRLLRTTRIQRINISTPNIAFGRPLIYDADSEPDLWRFVDSLSDCLFFTHLNIGLDVSFLFRPYEENPNNIIDELETRNRALAPLRQESFDQAKNLVQQLQPMEAAYVVAGTVADRVVIVDDDDRKIFYKAIVHLASRPHKTGANGILHILQERPQVLETTVVPTTTTSTRQGQGNDASVANDNNNNEDHSANNSSSGNVDAAVKRRRGKRMRTS